MLRLIAPDYYAVHEGGHRIGRIRYTRERSPRRLSVGRHDDAARPTVRLGREP